MLAWRFQTLLDVLPVIVTGHFLLKINRLLGLRDVESVYISSFSSELMMFTDFLMLVWQDVLG